MEDEMKRKYKNDNKDQMIKILDEQIEEKKRKDGLDKIINIEQARIWKQDGENFKLNNIEKHDRVYIS